MRRPRLRAPWAPFGFQVEDPQTRTGTLLACRACQTAYIASVNDTPAILETPYSAYTRHLPQWKAINGLGNSEEVRTDSCQFGSEHLKSFRFLGVHCDMSLLRVRCQGGHQHVKIEGGLTKASATYTLPLARQIALVLSEAVTLRKHRLQEDSLVEAKGLENQLVNEVALCNKWQVESCWTFPRESHINLLEEYSVLKLLKLLACHRKPLRAINLVDSFVVKGATSKGRSSSKGLSTVLRKVCSFQVAAAIYLTLPYVPTRHNPSDDPTRDTMIRQAVPGLCIDDWEEEDLYKLARLLGLRRWSSNWCRLTLRLVGKDCLSWSDRSKFRRSSHAAGIVVHSALEFDSTLGYPGEGPVSPCAEIGSSVALSSCCSSLCQSASNFWLPGFVHPLQCTNSRHHPCRSSLGLSGAVGLRCWVLLLLPLSVVHAMPTFPVSAGDQARAAARAQRPPVPKGRPVTGLTLTRRQACWEIFQTWFSDQGLDVEYMLENHQFFIDDLNLVLERFGRELYAEGKPYAHYAETLNHITTLKPAIRRQLQGAWSFGFSWVKHEPSTHHVAMPGPVALACITTALLWGWLRVAGALALMWAGLLRPGELLNALRRDLLLPSDGDQTMPFGLLSIRDPKTRHSSAKHQSAKIDMSDMLQVVEISMSKLHPGQKLWPYSGQTLRLRFQSILSALKLPKTDYNGVRPLELASIRAGAATWIMATTESGDLLQRRGRWANRRMMDIYVQEVTALLYLQQMPALAKDTVLQVASSFPQVMAKACELVQADIPLNVWPLMFMYWKRLVQIGQCGKWDEREWTVFLEAG